MRNIARHTKNLILLFVVVVGIASCRGLIDHNDNVECTYNVALMYHYNRENTTSANMLSVYVSTLDEYIFDKDGILFAINPLQIDKCTGEWRSELTLPPGRYSVITWGNLHSTCNINDARIGVTTREDMLLTLNNPCLIYAGYHNNSDRLFYGYRTFSVRANNVSRIRIDMLHSHLVLKYKVTWSGTSPNHGGNYQMRMKGNPSEYTFMTEFMSRDKECCEHIPSLHDDYRYTCNEIIHYIPKVLHTNVLDHRVNSVINVDKAVEGEIVAFRLRNHTPAILSLYEITENRSYTERQVMKDFDLNIYFTHHEIDLDHTLRQEYGLEFIINDDDTVTVIPLEISDWEEGGPL